MVGFSQWDHLLVVDGLDVEGQGEMEVDIPAWDTRQTAEPSQRPCSPAFATLSYFYFYSCYLNLKGLVIFSHSATLMTSFPTSRLNPKTSFLAHPLKELQNHISFCFLYMVSKLLWGQDPWKVPWNSWEPQYLNYFHNNRRIFVCPFHFLSWLCNGMFHELYNMRYHKKLDGGGYVITHMSSVH